MSKRFFILSFGMIVFAVSAWSQADTVFVLPAEVTGTTALTDSTFSVTATHAADQLGQAYLPTAILPGYRLFDGFGRLYRVDSVNNATLNSSTLYVTELQDGLAPAGAGMVYRKQTYSECIPVVPMANSNVSPATLARIFNHNAVNGCTDVSGLGGGGSVDSALYVTTTRLADSTAAVRADFPIITTKLDTVVVTSLNDSTFVAHNYAGGSIVRSDTITISGTGGGGSIAVGEDEIPYGDGAGGITSDASFIKTASGFSINNFKVEEGVGANSFRIGNNNSSSSGPNWVALGTNAGNSTTTAEGYFAAGLDAGESVTDGSYWKAQGQGAGRSQINGSFWNADGYFAARDNTSSIGRFDAIGANSARSNQNGDNFVSIGFNCALSYAAGGSATDFTKGVYIGSSVDVGEAGATNEVVIGYLAEGNGSNTVTIGNSSITDNYLTDNLHLEGTAAIHFAAHDSDPVGAEGVLYSDDSENRLKYHNGTSFSQLMIEGDETTAYTPTSTADATGSEGDISYDDSYIYIKTSAGWKRAALSTF